LINLGVGLLIAALPWLASGVLEAADLPPLLAYLVFPGRFLFVLLGGLVVLWALMRNRVPTDRIGLGLADITGKRAFAVCSLGLIALVAFARVPQPEKEAEAFGGDEPKYLRIAFSLLRDSDADVSGGRTQTPDFSTRLQQLRNLGLTSRDSVVELFRPVVVPPGHVWNAGNWTVRGLDGGLYHLQPPGLPALVAVALGVGEILLPERDPGIHVFVLLALVWVLAARELWRLSLEITADPLGSAVLVAMVFLSAPVFVGGYQLFPEALCLFLFPFLLRRLRTSERVLGPVTGLTCGLISGYLLWIHPKLTIVAVLFAAIALLRPQTSVRAKAAFAAGFFVTAFTALLYCHHISGFFRPEGLYIRQAEEYLGSPNPFSLRFAAGLVKALFGGRDGLLVFAPILALGLMALPAFKRPSRATLEVWSLFVVVWLTSAVHDGASLGSPARLMAPVVFVPALLLVRALRDGAPAKLNATALLLFALGCLITDTMASDWRRNVNPYRTMFANGATNFEPSLPGNSFSDAAYVIDLEKGAFLLAVLSIGSAFLARRRPQGSETLAPARFGAGVLAGVVALAFGLDWLTPR
jgi:hypothetical protein